MHVLVGKNDHSSPKKSFSSTVKVVSSLSIFLTYDEMASNLINNQTETPNHFTAALIGAVQNSRRIILSLGENINVRCKETGATLMHFAALNEKHGLDLIEYFSSLGLEVDAKNKFGEEPVDYALRVKNIKIATALLQKKKAKIVLKCKRDILFDLGENGNTAFHIAARDADLEMCKWLLGEGLDPRATSKDEFAVTALHLAGFNASHGTEIVEFLVSTLQMDVNAKDKVQNTPLHYALLTENFGVAEKLTGLGADLNENLLHFCIQKNKLAGAQFLHAKNQDLVGKTGKDGRNALHVAAHHSDLRMCQWLVKECGLDARAVAAKWKKSVLHYAAWNKLHGGEIISNFFWRFGLDLNISQTLQLVGFRCVLFFCSGLEDQSFATTWIFFRKFKEREDLNE
ncbi:Hypothetical predicted protein [Cloeon dipterum]|uniref:Uncharacterized protein n=1 Tax=Cloeon dipterum TaxID=197152 RepID=A0A8S1DY52_9INSE|nr:Hypothetical predicted protein [Cloeon dipterum]